MLLQTQDLFSAPPEGGLSGFHCGDQNVCLLLLFSCGKQREHWDEIWVLVAADLSLACPAAILTCQSDRLSDLTFCGS